MNILYTTDHEWVKAEGHIATVGITDVAQSRLGDLVFVELPEVGKEFVLGAEAAVVESVKAASDVLAPLSGVITEVNPAVVAEPTMVNADPMGTGWLFRMRISQAAEMSGLMNESAYREFAK